MQRLIISTARPTLTLRNSARPEPTAWNLDAYKAQCRSIVEKVQWHETRFPSSAFREKVEASQGVREDPIDFWAQEYAPTFAECLEALLLLGRAAELEALYTTFYYPEEVDDATRAAVAATWHGVTLEMIEDNDSIVLPRVAYAIGAGPTSLLDFPTLTGVYVPETLDPDSVDSYLLGVYESFCSDRNEQAAEEKIAHLCEFADLDAISLTNFVARLLETDDIEFFTRFLMDDMQDEPLIETIYHILAQNPVWRATTIGPEFARLLFDHNRTPLRDCLVLNPRTLHLFMEPAYEHRAELLPTLLLPSTKMRTPITPEVYAFLRQLAAEADTDALPDISRGLAEWAICSLRADVYAEIVRDYRHAATAVTEPMRVFTRPDADIRLAPRTITGADLRLYLDAFQEAPLESLWPFWPVSEVTFVPTIPEWAIILDVPHIKKRLDAAAYTAFVSKMPSTPDGAKMRAFFFNKATSIFEQNIAVSGRYMVPLLRAYLVLGVDQFYDRLCSPRVDSFLRSLHLLRTLIPKDTSDAQRIASYKTLHANEVVEFDRSVIATLQLIFYSARNGHVSGQQDVNIDVVDVLVRAVGVMLQLMRTLYATNVFMSWSRPAHVVRSAIAAFERQVHGQQVYDVGACVVRRIVTYLRERVQAMDALERLAPNERAAAEDTDILVFLRAPRLNVAFPGRRATLDQMFLEYVNRK